MRIHVASPRPRSLSREEKRLTQLVRFGRLQLGLGSIGSLVAHHIRRRFPRLPISLILSRRGLPEIPDREPGARSTAARSGFKIDVERDGQLQSTEGYTTEYIGRGLVKAHEDVDRLGSYEKTGREQRPLLRWKQGRAVARLSTDLTPDTPIDSLIVTLKCPDTASALGLLKHRITSETCVTLLQNGMGVYDEILGQVWPDGQGRPRFVLGSTTHGVKTVLVSSSRNHARRIVHTGFGKMQFGVVPHVGDGVTGDEDRALFPELFDPTSDGSTLSNPYETILTPPNSPALPVPQLGHKNLEMTLDTLLSLSDLSSTLLPSHLMHQTLLLKLAINAVINPLTALFRVKNGTVETDVEMKRMVKRLSEENSGIILGHLRDLAARSDGRARLLSRPASSSPSSLSSAAVDQDLHPPLLSPEITALFSPPSLTHRTLEVAKLTRENISSMSSHIGAHQPTEVDYINGHLVKLGQGVHGLPGQTDAIARVGMNRSLLGLIKIAETRSMAKAAKPDHDRWAAQREAYDRRERQGERRTGVEMHGMSKNALKREEYARRRLQAREQRTQKRAELRRSHGQEDGTKARASDQLGLRESLERKAEGKHPSSLPTTQEERSTTPTSGETK